MSKRNSLEFHQSERGASLVVYNRDGQPLGGVRFHRHGERADLELHRANQPEEDTVGNRSRRCDVLGEGVLCTAEVLQSNYRLPGNENLQVRALAQVLRRYMPPRTVPRWLPAPV